MSDALKVQGQCLCGETAFEVVLKDEHVDACHCSMCRSWAAGPFMGVACETPSFTKDGALGVFSSSEWGERVFCKSCGSSLFWRTKDKAMTIVSAGAVPLSSRADFTLQVFVDEKPDYYAFANATKTMTGAEVVAAFSASQGE
ncbi:GFA family protein [Woodsholea maritima]|uniref:GFA family protein n=1 Tax=Woodsholea maritima TaxID=240237 RepID=UPI0003693E8E|nr:GFA family protein [Woodsholea maritima]